MKLTAFVISSSLAFAASAQAHSISYGSGYGGGYDYGHGYSDAHLVPPYPIGTAYPAANCGVYPGYDRLAGPRRLVGYYGWPCGKQADIVLEVRPSFGSAPCYDPCRARRWPVPYPFTGY